METSSCLITPTQANFLLNGKGVERRYNNFMDTGPQMPSSVNHFLKLGTNLLQAIGQFDGNYIIVIAVMTMGSTPDHSTIQDYVQPTISMIDPDSEVIEGSSRISLNCPISSHLVSEIGVSEPRFNNVISPVLTDASTPVTYREAGPLRGDSQVDTSLSHNQICTSNSLQLQQSQLGNPVLSNEYGHISSTPRHMNRTPVAGQALPVQSLTSVYQQRPINHLFESRPSIAPQTSAVSLIGDTISSVHNNIGRQHQFPGVEHYLHRPPVSLSRMHQNSNPHTVGRQSPSQVQSSYRLPGSSQQPMMMRQSATFSPPQLYQCGPPTNGTVASQQARGLAGQHAAMMARPVNTSRTPSHYSVNLQLLNELRTTNGIQRENTPSQRFVGDVPMEVTAEQNWRPTGCMRGSLFGRAYSDAYNLNIIRPTQQPQAGTQKGQAAAPILMVSASQWEFLMTNRAALHEARGHPGTGSLRTTDAWSHRQHPT